MVGDWLPRGYWPWKFNGPVLVYAPSMDPIKPFMVVAWWDGERLSLLPDEWIPAVTHIHLLVGPEGGVDPEPVPVL